MIRILATGTLHTDPVQRTSANGNPFTTAKLKADSKDGVAVWCSLIAFGADAERLATLKAGAALAVSGRCELSAWSNQEGEPKAGLSLVVDELATLRGKPRPKPEAQASPTPAPAPQRFRRPQHQPVETVPFDDDLTGLGK